MIGRDGQDVRLPRADARRGLRRRRRCRGRAILAAGRAAPPSGVPAANHLGVVPAPRSNRLWVQDPANPSAWHKVGLPTAPAADPIVWGVASYSGAGFAGVIFIDPLTGPSRAEPFVPKFDRDRQGTWLSPARLDQDVVLADDVGRVRSSHAQDGPVARLVGEAERVLDQRIIADPASTGDAVIVATADRHVRALAARDLSPVGSWALDAPLAGPPIGIGETCFVMDRAGGVMAFSRDGQRTWSIKLDSAVVGAPVVVDQSVWFLTRGGKLHVRDLSNGREREQIGAGQLAERRARSWRANRSWFRPARGRSGPWRPLPQGENRP